jgi:hypothetical protein
MNNKLKLALASYARSFAVAVVTAYSMGQTEIQDLALAGVIAILGPTIRAMNPKDSAFGMVDNTVSVDLDKLAKATKKKAVKKK